MNNKNKLKQKLKFFIKKCLALGEYAMKKKAIICDIDGCLLDTAHIHDEIARLGLEGVPKWRYFEQNANRKDKVKFNHRLGEFLELFYRRGYHIILLTVRSEIIRNATRLRLEREFSDEFKFTLLMRALNDISPAPDIKKKHLANILKNYNVHLVIDDEDDNLKMFSACGLFAMKAI